MSESKQKEKTYNKLLKNEEALKTEKTIHTVLIILTIILILFRKKVPPWMMMKAR